MASLDISVNASAGDEGLRSCLEGARVPEALITHLTTVVGLQSLRDFVNLVTTQGYEQELKVIADGCEDAKEKPVVLSRLRAAWRSGQAALRSIEQRAATADAATDFDQPLQDAAALEVQDAWDKRYHLTLEIRVSPSDGLVARLYREFRRNAATVIPVSKCRSLFQANKPKVEKSVALADQMRIEFGQQDEAPARTVIDYYWGLRTLANASAKAGNYPVKSKAAAGEVTMAPLSVNLDYADFALRSTVEVGLHASGGIGWLELRDTTTRGKMVAYMRQGWPQGEALTRAVAESQVAWTVRGVVGGERDRRPDRSRGRSRTPPKRTRRLRERGRTTRSPDKNGARADVQLTKPQTGTTLPGGARICKPFADGRGCTKTERDCPNAARHVCDIITKRGKVCGLPHPRAQHQVNRE